MLVEEIGILLTENFFKLAFLDLELINVIRHDDQHLGHDGLGLILSLQLLDIHSILNQGPGLKEVLVPPDQDILELLVEEHEIVALLRELLVH